MDTRITSEELIRMGFVPEPERERLRKYLEARGRFLGSFGPRSDVSDGLKHGLSLLKDIREWSGSVPAAIQAHGTYLADQILPLVRQVAEPEEGETIEREVREFGTMVQNAPGPDPYGPLQQWLEEALARNQELTERLLGLKARLEEPSGTRAR